MPYSLLNTWLSEEKTAGAPNPKQGVLSTVSPQGAPHSRVVAIREISANGSLLFFTQKGTRKVTEMAQNNKASFTFWFELLQRQIIIEGLIEAISEEENKAYWETYPKEAQIRFSAYAPTSSEVITSKDILETKREEIAAEFKNQAIPYNSLYCGFRLKPQRFAFYAYKTLDLSEAFEFTATEDTWKKSLLSP